MSFFYLPFRQIIFGFFLCCSAVIAAESDTDFFADLPEEARDESAEPESKPGRDLGSLITGFFEGDEGDDDGLSEYDTPIEAVLPRTGLMLARTSPVEQLDKSLSVLLKKFGFGKLSPTDWIALSPYGKAFKYVDRHRPLGACWYDLSGSQEPGIALFVPVRHYRPFIELLGADLSSYEKGTVLPEGIVFPLKKPGNSAVFQIKGYAVILKEEECGKAAAAFLKASPIGAAFYRQTGLRDPDFRFVITPYGIPRFANLNSAMYSEFREVLPEILVRIRESNPDFNLSAEDVNPKLNRFSQSVSQGLAQLVQEIKLTPEALLSSTIFLPDPASRPTMRPIPDGASLIPTLLDQSEFLKVLPPAFAPLTGQIDLYSNWADQLDPPFNRIRHIEYSFGVPQQGELLAESCAFFLEVDNSEAFVQELIIPKARLIGSHIGAEQVGQFAGQLLGSLSLRRQSRGARPLFYDSPESAASAGTELGEMIGSEIGRQLGEDQAMRKFDFEGYPLYVSDMELYIREMRKITLEASGDRGPRSASSLTGESTLRNFVTDVLAGLETGSFDGVLRRRILGNSADMNNAPLPVRENLILLLDKEHILIVPGNRDLLAESLHRWQEFVARKGKGVSGSSADWQKNRDILYAEMANGDSQILRSVARFDLAAAQSEADYLRQFYDAEIQPLVSVPVPADLPAPLFVGTDTRDTELIYSVIPDGFLKFLIDSLQERQKQKPQ